ncbi:MAG: hypothetical protein HC890_11800 [Chloroflexaceae bacterium]|nr:hypothetical protein [Chloroflexaceae bacterium]
MRSPAGSVAGLAAENSLPSQVLQAFRQQVAEGASLDFSAKNQLQELFALLERWQQPKSSPKPTGLPIPWLRQDTPPAIANLVTLGEDWLTAAIRAQLIAPLPLEALPEWSKLPPAWQNVARRNAQGFPDPRDRSGRALPQRQCGCRLPTGQNSFFCLEIARLGRFMAAGINRTDFPAGHPRIAIGIALKKLGYSFNQANLSEISDLKAELTSLRQQVKFYSANHYLEPLLLGDTWAAVGWSADILPVLERYPTLSVIVPRSDGAVDRSLGKTQAI